jgi:hypothetical protein
MNEELINRLLLIDLEIKECDSKINSLCKLKNILQSNKSDIKYLMYMNKRGINSVKENNLIKNIVIGELCLQSNPCQHDCEIHYIDEIIVKKRLKGKFIAENYFDNLNDNDKKHFYIYLIS